MRSGWAAGETEGSGTVSGGVNAAASTAAGTTALRSGTLQRLFRDVHAGTQHITSGPGVIKAAGKELAGLAPGHKWMVLDIVDLTAGGASAH